MFESFTITTTGVTCGTGSATLPEFTTGFREVCVLVLIFCVMCCRSLFVALSFSNDHCIVCTSSVYDFWLLLWYLKLFFQNRIKIWQKQTQINTSNTYIHDRSLSCRVTCTSITSGKIKLIIWTQAFPLSEIMLSCNCYLHAGKMPPSFIIRGTQC